MTSSTLAISTSRSTGLLTGFGLALIVLALGGCSGQLPFLKSPNKSPEIPVCDPEVSECLPINIPDENTLRPRARPGSGHAGPGLISGARPEELDTTTKAEVDAATTITADAAERKLGTTIASLGDVSVPGFWMQTPLVAAEINGRVTWADNDNSVNLTLKPKEGANAGGSQISLAALRALGIPLTALPELIVFAH